MAHNNKLDAIRFLHLEKDGDIKIQVSFYFGHWSDCGGDSKRYVFVICYIH